MKNEILKQRLWKVVDDKKEDLLCLCSEMIQIPSENPPGDMEDITRLICNELNRSNIVHEVIRPQEDKPNIVATLGKGGEKTLLLNGHSDVVPAGDRSKWDFDPFCGKIIDGKILGRGTSDMKAGLGALIFAMKVLADEEVEINGKIVLHVVPDEETSGEMGTKWLVENGYADGGDACLIAEPTSYNNCEVGQKGSLWLHIKSYGKSAHGSIGNYVGDNAILKLTKILNAMEEIRTLKGIYNEDQKKVLEDSKRIAKEVLEVDGVENVIDHVTVNIGTIHGGTKTNMVADYCEATVDIRVPIGIKIQDVVDKFENIVERLGIVDIEYEYNWNSEANYTDTNTEIVQSAVTNAQKIWNKEVVPAYQWASSDARYYRYAGIPTIQYGPANIEGIHAYNETVDIEDVINATKVYLGIMTDLLDIQ
ncbi:M20 family metallopeptidase [Natronincola ferrireducens]|uniref:Probable succinyl-diaminopimelate desuccinylase n=1 Tax=Natronincola ferrireducens TaxID=393762 RepID=A0A1G9E4P7_9FIRM|nr:ArgE/DapE family deacylase [Natronincola ferrireducens]SDK71078.1 succinyl-diaminopimelate desuccinylase [Natronincola ferrireducens]